MRLSPRDRVLVLAPHPDDETLGAGGLLQRAAAAGASCRVVFVTDGDNNPWPQRLVEWRLRIDAEARVRWAARRRAEGFAALDALGIPRTCAVFLGFPDQGLTRLLADAPTDVVGRLGAELVDWRPTVVVMPSLRDHHPDHNAVAVLALATLDAVPAEERPIVLTYAVHPFATPSFADGVHLHLTRAEQARKRVAIERHRTQLIFHGRAYRRAASSVESLATLPGALRLAAPSAVEQASIGDAVVRVRLASRVLIRPAVLSVIGWDATMRHVAMSAELFPGRRRVPVRSGYSGAVFGSATRFRDGSGVHIHVPLPRAIRMTRFFVKLTMRAAFFDSDGWIEGVAPPDAAAPQRRYAVR